MQESIHAIIVGQKQNFFCDVFQTSDFIYFEKNIWLTVTQKNFGVVYLFTKDTLFASSHSQKKIDVEEKKDHVEAKKYWTERFVAMINWHNRESGHRKTQICSLIGYEYCNNFRSSLLEVFYKKRYS